MNKALVRYEIKDSMVTIVALLFYALSVSVIFFIFDKKISVPVIDTMVVAFSFCTVSIAERANANGHQCFGYSRKSEFKVKLIVLSLQGAVLAVLRTAAQILCYDQYVQFFIGDMDETASMYHMPFIPLVLLVNLLIFETAELLNIIARTSIYNTPKDMYTLVMKERAARVSGKKLTTIRIVCFIALILVMIPFIMLCVMTYSVQAKDETVAEVLIIAGFIIVDIIMYFIAKKRYSPKYI